MINSYSPTWFELFMQPIDAAQSAAEVAFVARQLPLPRYGSIIDLCCGTGRHSRLLAERGYQVLGVDANPEVLAAAREQGAAGVRYIELDMRSIGSLPGSVDAVVSLWQSFGYFDAATNAAVLRQIAGKLAPQGRLILDLYHRGFFEQHREPRSFVKEGRQVTETRALRGDRLTVQLSYDRLPGDSFDWQVFTPEQIEALAASCGLRTLLACSSFDEALPPSPQRPRMQLLFEKA